MILSQVGGNFYFFIYTILKREYRDRKIEIPVEISVLGNP